MGKNFCNGYYFIFGDKNKRNNLLGSIMLCERVDNWFEDKVMVLEFVKIIFFNFFDIRVVYVNIFIDIDYIFIYI